MLCFDKLLRSMGAIIALGLVLSLAAPARAVVVTWDFNSTGGTADGSGTWNAANTNWWNSTSEAAWTSGGTAQFGVGSPAANPYTVTLSGSLAANAIIFQNQAYTITPSAGTLNLNGTAPFITVNANGGTIASIVTGTAGLTKTGSGTLTFVDASNTYTGTTNIIGGGLTFAGSAAKSGAGILNVSGAAGSGTSGPVLNVNTSGTIVLNGNSTVGGGLNTSGAMNQSSGLVSYNNTGANYSYIGGSLATTTTGCYGSYFLSGGSLINTSGQSVGIQVGEVPSGATSSGNIGIFTQSGGFFSNGRAMFIGNGVGSLGIVTFSGGTATLGPGSGTQIGNTNGIGGAFNVGTEAGGTATLTQPVGFQFTASANLNASLNLNHGTLAFTAGGINKNGAAGSGVVNFNGGTVQAAANNLTLINNTPNSVNIYNGGAIFDTLANSATVSANLLATSGNGIYLSGGTLAVAGGSGGAGYVGAPYVSVTDTTTASGSGASAIATITNGAINGITLTCPGQGYSAGDVLKFSFSGGGAAMPVSSYSYTLSPADLAANGTGGVTKVGAGTLYLTGANTYTGTTNVTAGTLALGGAMASTAYNVAGGAVFSPNSATLGGNPSLSASGTVNFLFGSATLSTLNGPSAAVVNIPGTQLIVNNGGTFAGSLQDGGNGGSLNIGGGLLALAGNNTYNGGTTISAGTLQVGIGGATGSVGTGSVMNYGLLAFSRSDTGASALVVPGNISGSGAVVINGSGSVTFSGANSYAGTTAVNNGTLIVNGSHYNGDAYTVAAGATLAGSGTIGGSNAIILNSGANIAPGNNVTTGGVGTLTVPNLSIAGGGGAYFDLSNNPASGNDAIVVSGSLALNGSTTVVINPVNSTLGSGNYALFDYTPGSLSYSSSATALVLSPGVISPRQTAYFDYGSTTPGVVSLDVVSGPPLNLTWVGGTHAGFANVWNQNSAGNTAWNDGSTANYFATGDSVTFDATSANTTVTVSGAVSPSSVAVTGASNYTFTGAGSIGGGTSLVVQGPGSLTLDNSGGNGYTGGTFIQGGSIKLGVTNGLPIGGTLTIGSETGNGTFDMAGYSQTLGGLATDPAAAPASQFIGNSVASSTSTLTFSSTGTANFAGNIQDGVNGAGGRVALTVNAGQLTLGGSNTYTGPTSISSAGTLQLNSATAVYAGAATNNLVANGVFDLNGYNAGVAALSGSGTIGDSTNTSPVLTFGNNNANSTFSGSIGVYGGISAPALNKTGGGMVVLTGSNYASAVSVTQGTLQIGNDTVNGMMGGGAYSIASGAELYFNQGSSPTTPTWANISGSGTLELNDAATSSAVAYSQLALPPGFVGTLQVDHRGRIQGTPGNLGAATNVVLNSGAQFLAYDGSAGSLAYTYTQNFTIAGFGSETGQSLGALRVSGMHANLTGNITLAGDSALYTQTNNGGTAIQVSGVISGNYSLTINDNQTVNPIVLAGANTYTGSTSVAIGTLDLANSAALLNSTLTTGGIIFDAVAGGAFTFGGLSGSGAIALNDTGSNAVALSVGNNNQSTTYTGALSGPGSLTTIGTGSLVLGGANTYLGTTTISAGTLQAGNGGSTGSPGAGTGNIVNNGLLVINRSDTGASALAISGNMSGSGSLVLNGSGGVTLSGSNTYAGSTAVNAGTLIVNGTHVGDSAYTVAAGATLAGAGTIGGTNSIALAAGANIAPGNNVTTGGVGTLTVPSLSLGGSGTAYFDLSNSTSGGNDLIQVDGALSLGNSTNVVVMPYNGSLASGNYPLFDYTGSLSYASSATSLIMAPGALTVRQSAYFDYGSTAPGVVSLDVVGVALNLKWVGGTQGGFTNTWNQNVTANTVWSGGNYFASGDMASFDATSANTTVSISGAVSPSVVTVTGANAYTFTGPGQITGNGALNVTGSGSLTIANSGGNNYVGGTNIQSGAISLGENNGLPVAGTLTLGSAGGSGYFNLAGYNQQVGSLATNAGAIAANQIIGNSAASTTSTLTYNNTSGSAAFGGTIVDHVGGSGGQTALTIAGGLLNLGGSNTYTGVTTVSTGTLQMGSAAALYAGAAANNLVVGDTFDLAGFNAGVAGLTGGGTVINSSTTAATLTVGNNNASSGVFAGILQGSTLNLNKVGNGTQVITGTNNAFSTTVSQGTLQIGNAAVNGTISTSVYAINPGANLYLNYATAATPPWTSFAGGGTLELNSAQPVNATAEWGRPALSSSFSGALQLDNGRVEAVPADLGGATSVVINANGQFLAFDNTSNLNSYIYPQNFSLNGFGWGEGGEQFGALRVSGMNATFSGNITLTGTTGIFEQPNHPGQITVSGNISGAYPLAINVGGNTGYTFTLSGSNNYTGPTTIGGIVDLANSAALLDTTLTPGTGTIEFDSSVTAQGQGFTFGGLSGTGAIALNDTATNPVALTVGNNNASNTYSGTLSGPGSLTVIGSGTFTLSGTNTYTGGTTVVDSSLVVTNSQAIEDGTNLSVGDPALLSMLPAVAVPSPVVPATAVAIAPVPEPATLGLLTTASGAAAILLFRRKRRTGGQSAKRRF